jgi:hypothetical protein
VRDERAGERGHEVDASVAKRERRLRFGSQGTSEVVALAAAIG